MTLSPEATRHALYHNVRVVLERYWETAEGEILDEFAEALANLDALYALARADLLKRPARSC